MHIVTETQYYALLVACSTAENPGGCTYTSGCVVAKLCDFYKVPYPKLNDLKVNPGNPAQLPFHENLCNDLQKIWDSDEATHESMLRWLFENVTIQDEPKQEEDDVQVSQKTTL